jgi:branched-chain amino acid transport system ATP-binding protein
MNMPLLQAKDLCVSYGDLDVLNKLSIHINRSEIVGVIGANGAGKTTLLRTLSGLLQVNSGEVYFQDRKISGLNPYEIVELGVVQVPEGRKLFPSLTVRENLELGSIIKACKIHRQESLSLVYDLFPILKEREKQSAGTLSGGEQQMVAVARGLMSRPKLFMLDEPSLGLAPLVVKEIFGKIIDISKAGTTILLVEQNVHIALQLCSRAYVLENGIACMEGSGKQLLADGHVKQAYLGL